MRALAALLGGLLFGLGLTVSGMTDPANVLAFLTLGAGWNGALVVVMGSAVVVTAVGYALTLRRDSPQFADRFEVPAPAAIDARLISGAVSFGLGWGLAGYCPGPALVGVFVLDARALVFFIFFQARLLLFQLFQRQRSNRDGAAPAAGDG